MIPGPFVGINYLYQNARNMKVDNYIKRFLVTPDEEILGAIFSNEQYDATTQTRNAWLSEISTLKAALQQFAQNDNAYIFFEYTIPRVDGRIDCGLIINGILFVIEFKTGEGADEALGAYKEQVMQYVTDLKNFHFESYDIPIVPVLLIDNLPHSSMRLSWKDENAHLYSLVSINSDSLRPLIEKVLKETVGQSIIDPVQWLRSPYCPTANIVEAARELFNNHTVADIKRSDAKGENLVRTTERIMSLIHQARDNHEKYLCMITGVPGAGKTLIGLSVATEYKNEEKQNRSVYLSGNHPLVAVLQEALAKDAYQREKEARDAVLATIEDAENIKNLPLMLSVFLDEYNKAKKNSKTGLFKIPVSDITVKYNKENLSTRVITKDNESVSIYNSSSGVQSVVPLSIVTRFLAENSVFDLEKDIQSLSNNEKKQLKPVLQNPLFFQFGGYEQAEEIMDAVLYGRKYDKEQYEKISIALKPFFNSCFVNIVEEPEQNLYPDSQSKVLYELIECMNVTENNSLFFTTHSPYMLSFLTLAAKADNLLKRGVPEEKIEPIVPVKAAVSGKNISVYETFEDGSIRKLEPYDELPSDDNLLNKAMAQSNELFAQLIDLEQEFCG